MNTKQAHKILEQIRLNSLDDFAERVAENLQDNIKEMWYDAYTPEGYDRTYELLNSVGIRQTKAGRQVYIDEDSITNGGRQGGDGWTEHVGVTGERDDSFADMLNDDMQGNPRGGNKRVTLGVSGGGFWEATEDWVEDNIQEEITNLVITELGRNNIHAKATSGNVAYVKGNFQRGIRIKI